MSSLKSLKLLLEPLYLKSCGRIVGAFSKMTLGLYIGFALFTVSSLLLLFIFTKLPGPLGAAKVQEEQQGEQDVKSIQDQPVVSTVIPAPKIAKAEQQPVKEEKEPQEQKIAQQESLPATKSIAGKIQLDFGWQHHPVYHDWRYHTGVDIEGKNGQEVRAFNNGQVMEIYTDRHSGLTVVVKDDTYHIYYGALSEVMVKQGSRVKANQVIGKMGNCPGEPYEHLHLAIKEGQHYIDPNSILAINKK